MGNCLGDKLGRRDSSIPPIFRVPRRLNDSAAYHCLVERVQELGVRSTRQELGVQRQQRANVSVVRRAPLRVRIVDGVRVVNVVDGVGAVGALERADRLRHGSRRGGHGGKMHA